MSSAPPEDPLRARVTELAARAIGPIDRIEAIAPGLGARRFFRIHFASGELETAVARVEAAPDPSALTAAEPPLEPIRAFLERHGLPVPAQYASDGDVSILEDIGDTSLEQVASGPDEAERQARYTEAVDLVPRLQSLEPPPSGEIAAFSRHLDADLIETKARKWREWTIPFALDRPATPGEQEATARAFAHVASACTKAPRRLAHRDFKAANLHLRPAARGASELVMIDLQGAFMAPPEYDLVCLLRDAHVALPEDEANAQLARIRSVLPDAPAVDVFERRTDLITIARVAKDISHYVDAHTTRRDSRYLRFIPEGLRNLLAATERAAQRESVIEPFAESLEAVARALQQRLAAEPESVQGEARRRPCAP